MSFRFKKLTISKKDAKHLISIYVPNPESKDKFKLVKSESTSPDKAIQEFSFENKEHLIAFREALNKLVL